MADRSAIMTASIAALVTATLMVVATAAVIRVPHFYDAADPAAWAAGIATKPSWTTASAWAFAAGLLVSVPFYVLLAGLMPRAMRGPAVAGAAMVSAAATLNAAASLGPFIVAREVTRANATTDSLLAMAVAVDALHNAAIGVALLLFLKPMSRARWMPPAGLVLQGAAGITSLGAGLQSIWPPADKVVYVSGWLWVAWLVVTGIALLRAPATSDP